MTAVLRPLARLLHHLAGPSCCDCSCGDCADNGHTCTTPIFGPRELLGRHTAPPPEPSRHLHAVDDAHDRVRARLTEHHHHRTQMERLDHLTVLVTDIRDRLDRLIVGGVAPTAPDRESDARGATNPPPNPN